MARPRKYFTEEEAKEAHRASHRASQAKWVQKNPDYKADWDRNNPDYYANYYQENKEDITVKHKEYRTTLTGMCVQKSSNYRTVDRLKFDTDEGSVTAEQMKEMIELQPHCFYCGETDFLKLGLDRIDNSKPHTIDNCVVCCLDCNNHRQKIPFKEFCIKKGVTI